MSAYEKCLTVMSTRDSPWYVVPADSEKNAPLVLSQIIGDTSATGNWLLSALNSEMHSGHGELRHKKRGSVFGCVLRKRLGVRIPPGAP
ncbi:hypothetical protein RCH22_000561 [Cryobacterium psychrotolerans]|nr:hypothetical protein [Cryobacterium psychrotolerans]